MKITLTINHPNSYNPHLCFIDQELSVEYSQSDNGPDPYFITGEKGNIFLDADYRREIDVITRLQELVEYREKQFRLRGGVCRTLNIWDVIIEKLY